ncbi:MAG: PilZ domain-containing protein [Candidatus Hydrogenedentes bacterium]|nr:PilZ domain-containing protein [Candidatus Hydrogenedentota bacterium]
MATQLETRRTGDQRIFARVPYSAGVTYRYGVNEGGIAASANLGRGGACLTLGRYLRPGRYVMLSFEAAPADNEPVELKAQVMWCRPTNDAKRFEAGVRIFHDEPDVNVALSELLYDAMLRAGQLNPLLVERVVPAEWYQAPTPSTGRPTGVIASHAWKFLSAACGASFGIFLSYTIIAMYGLV